MGQAYISCFPAGTIQPVNVAERGRPGERISCSCRRIKSGPSRGRVASFAGTPKPIQVTSSPMSLSSPLPSKDGKKLFVVGETIHGELMRYDLKSGQFAPFLGGISAETPAFSRDGQWVAYVSYPEGILFRSKADGSERLQLTYPAQLRLQASLVTRRQVARVFSLGQ